jgi:hypothetical protein
MAFLEVDATMQKGFEYDCKDCVNLFMEQPDCLGCEVLEKAKIDLDKEQKCKYDCPKGEALDECCGAFEDPDGTLGYGSDPNNCPGCKTHIDGHGGGSGENTEENGDGSGGSKRRYWCPQKPGEQYEYCCKDYCPEPMSEAQNECCSGACSSDTEPCNNIDADLEKKLIDEEKSIDEKSDAAAQQKAKEKKEFGMKWLKPGGYKDGGWWCPDDKTAQHWYCCHGYCPKERTPTTDECCNEYCPPKFVNEDGAEKHLDHEHFHDAANKHVNAGSFDADAFMKEILAGSEYKDDYAACCKKRIEENVALMKKDLEAHKMCEEVEKQIIAIDMKIAENQKEITELDIKIDEEKSKIKELNDWLANIENQCCEYTRDKTKGICGHEPGKTEIMRHARHRAGTVQGHDSKNKPLCMCEHLNDPKSCCKNGDCGCDKLREDIKKAICLACPCDNTLNEDQHLLTCPVHKKEHDCCEDMTAKYEEEREKHGITKEEEEKAKACCDAKPKENLEDKCCCKERDELQGRIDQLEQCCDDRVDTVQARDKCRIELAELKTKMQECESQRTHQGQRIGQLTGELENMFKTDKGDPCKPQVDLETARAEADSCEKHTKQKIDDIQGQIGFLQGRVTYLESSLDRAGQSLRDGELAGTVHTEINVNAKSKCNHPGGCQPMKVEQLGNPPENMRVIQAQDRPDAKPTTKSDGFKETRIQLKRLRKQATKREDPPVSSSKAPVPAPAIKKKKQQHKAKNPSKCCFTQKLEGVVTKGCNTPHQNPIGTGCYVDCQCEAGNDGKGHCVFQKGYSIKVCADEEKKLADTNEQCSQDDDCKSGCCAQKKCFATTPLKSGSAHDLFSSRQFGSLEVGKPCSSSCQCAPVNGHDAVCDKSTHLCALKVAAGRFMAVKEGLAVAMQSKSKMKGKSRARAKAKARANKKEASHDDNNNDAGHDEQAAINDALKSRADHVHEASATTSAHTSIATPRWTCGVTAFHLSRGRVHDAFTTPDAYRTATTFVQQVASQIAGYAGLSKTTTVENPHIAIESTLTAPAKLPFRPIVAHFFSDIDGRAKYAIMGTPGGDIGEFILALNAFEKVRAETGPKRLLDFEDVLNYFQSYLQDMTKEGKQIFYMGTDTNALKNIAEATGVKDPLQPQTAEEREKIIAVSGLPDSISSLHLKLMIEKEQDYQVRAKLIECAIKAFLTIYFDTSHPLRPRLLLAALSGIHRERAIIEVEGLDAVRCGGLSPLIVPSQGRDQVFVYHKAAADVFRATLAKFFDRYLGGRDQMGNSDDRSTTAKHMYEKMVILAGDQVQRTFSQIAKDLPRLQASYVM